MVCGLILRAGGGMGRGGQRGENWDNNIIAIKNFKNLGFVNNKNCASRGGVEGWGEKAYNCN